MSQRHDQAGEFRGSGHFLPLLALLLLGVPACRVSDLPIWGPAIPPTGALEVDHVYDVPYGDEPEPGSCRRHMDLFIPRGRKDYPVVFLIHGGVWMTGDNRCCGLYASVGEYLASQGIGAVLTNYRLSPGVKHPEHIKDVARAFAWTHAHIAEYGGCPDKLFVLGHSAGGHLAALLATDETWLNAEGLTTKDIKGMIVISGVYHIPRQERFYALGGFAPDAFRLGQLLPVRRESCCNLTLLPGIPLKIDVFCLVFGTDPVVRDDASPLNHVHPGLPPFLLVYSENDLPTLPEMAEEFHKALVEQGCESQLLKVARRNHNSAMFKAIEPEDPVGGAMVEFIRHHTGELEIQSLPNNR